MYWTDFAEIIVSPYSGRATEHLRELLKVTDILLKVISYLVLRFLGNGALSQCALKR